MIRARALEEKTDSDRRKRSLVTQSIETEEKPRDLQRMAREKATTWILGALLVLLWTPGVGVCGPGSRFGLTGPAPSQDTSGYSLVLRSGAKMVWWRMGWPEICDPRTNRYDWSEFDSDMEQALKDSVVVVMKLFTGGGWEKVRGGGPYTPTFPSAPPRDLEEYRQFVRKTAEHFRGRIRYWEIGNEPYGEGKWTGTNEEYFQLLQVSAQALHEVDSFNVVSNGGLNAGPLVDYHLEGLVSQGKGQAALDLYARFWGRRPRSPKLRGVEGLRAYLRQHQRGIDFVRLLLEKGYRDLDVLEFHAYESYEILESLLTILHEEMKANGWSRPIRMKTGFGPDADGEDAQAQAVVKNMVTCLGNGVEKVMWFTLIDGRDNSNGLVRVDRTRGLCPKRAYHSFVQAVTLLEDFTRAEKVNLGREPRAYRFVRPQGTTWVVWSEKSSKVKVPVGAARVTRIDTTGKREELKSQKGEVSLDLTPVPVFILEG
jgi:hypothetical protein